MVSWPVNGPFCLHWTLTFDYFDRSIDQSIVRSSDQIDQSIDQVDRSSDQVDLSIDQIDLSSDQIDRSVDQIDRSIWSIFQNTLTFDHFECVKVYQHWPLWVRTSHFLPWEGRNFCKTSILPNWWNIKRCATCVQLFQNFSSPHLYWFSKKSVLG